MGDGAPLGLRGCLAAALALASGFQVSPGGIATLKRIYDEVRTTPSPSGPEFLSQDVFIGGPDDDDTNKDVHVALLVQTVGGEDLMHIRITALERSAADRRIKHAGETRDLVCAVRDGALRLIRSDVPAAEIPHLAEDILRAVLDKKRLIRPPAPQAGPPDDV